MKSIILSGMAGLILITLIGVGIAAPPPMINYQGVLYDKITGSPVHGSCKMDFRIYDENGTACWPEIGPETHDPVEVENGIFKIILGSKIPINLDSNVNEYWLGITVNDEETDTRLRLVSSPYAIQAQEAEYAVSALNATNADMVDGLHASQMPSANKLLALDSAGKFPHNILDTGSGSGLDADTVDTFHASQTPTSYKLLPLNSTGKFPNSVLNTGTGGGLDADTVDNIHASQSPTANNLLALDGGGKFPDSVLNTGPGSGFNADMVDNIHASQTPTANKLLPLNNEGKFPHSILNTGPGSGLNADMVDNLHASQIPSASKLLALNNDSKFPNDVLYTGSGNGLDADTVDGIDASELAVGGLREGCVVYSKTSEHVGLSSYYTFKIWRTLDGNSFTYLGEFTSELSSLYYIISTNNAVLFCFKCSNNDYHRIQFFRVGTTDGITNLGIVQTAKVDPMGNDSLGIKFFGPSPSDGATIHY